MTNSPSDFATQLQQAQQRFSAGDFDQAVDLIEAVVVGHPDQPRVLIECARAFARCYHIPRAEALLDSVLARAPTDSRHTLARVYQQIYRPERAVELLEHAHREKQLPLPAVAQLGTLYEQSNRKQEAVDALSQCVRQAPSQPQPKVLLSRLLRQSGKLHEAQAMLQTVVSSQSTPTATLVHAWSELAIVFDQQQDYEQASNAMENAKALLRGIPDVQQQAQRSLKVNEAFRSLYARVDASLIKQWMSTHLGNLKTKGIAHLIGFPRSGTTLMEQMLDAHESVYTASERAVFTRAIYPAMFRNGGMTIDTLNKCSTNQLDDLRNRYIASHEAIAGLDFDDQVLIDKNPNHTSLLLGLLRVFPESKILFALRDPRDVIVSTYMRFFSISEFSASYLTWKSTCELYAHEMNVWLKMRSLLPENWIEVKYEDTVDDPKQATQRVADLLGIAWDDSMLARRNDGQKFVHSPTHAEVRKPIYQTSVGRWKQYERHLQPHLGLLEPFMKAFGYDD